MPSITPKKLIKFLRAKDFYISRQSGSHVILHSYSDSEKRVVVPLHNKDLKRGTLDSVLKDAGLEYEELFKKK